MSHNASLKPVGDSVPKIDNELAVGEDLDFQRRWWRFEKVVWGAFLVIIICDLVGLFGRGWLARAEVSTPDKAFSVEYEWIERANTSSTMTLRFGTAAIRDGKVDVYVSDSVVQDLGAEQIMPQPLMSVVGQGGNVYRFPANGGTASVRIKLQPVTPGIHVFRVQSAGCVPVTARVYVLP